MNEKLKKSVDKDKFDFMVEENKYLREKNNQLTLRDIEVTKETTNNQTLLIKYKDLEESYFNLQESKYDDSAPLDLMVSTISMPLEVIADNLALSRAWTREMLTLAFEIACDKKPFKTMVTTPIKVKIQLLLIMITK